MTGSEGLWIGVDVGGTKVLAGAVDPGGRVRRTARRSTPDSAAGVDSLEALIADAVAEIAGGRSVAGVGVAAAGLVDADGERVVFAPHLPWRGERVRERLGERIDAPVLLENDATCAAFAEWRFGAARGSDQVLLVTLGTGIGGGLVLGGRLHRGQHGMAGEFGHMIVVADGAPCPCGGRGCWEQYVSGSALARLARSRLGHEDTMLTEWCAGDPAALTGEMVTEAARAGDPVGVGAFAQTGEWLGIGLASLVAALDPERVIVGGGLAGAGDLLLAPARRVMRRSLIGAGQRVLPPLLPAMLGSEAGLVGAAELARRPLSR